MALSFAIVRLFGVFCPEDGHRKQTVLQTFFDLSFLLESPWLIKLEEEKKSEYKHRKRLLLP